MGWYEMYGGRLGESICSAALKRQLVVEIERRTARAALPRGAWAVGQVRHVTRLLLEQTCLL